MLARSGVSLTGGMRAVEPEVDRGRFFVAA